MSEVKYGLVCILIVLVLILIQLDRILEALRS